MFKKILKRLPIIALLFATGASIKYALGWREEWDRIMDNTQNMIEVPPEKLDKVKNGDASLMVTYVNGNKIVDLITPEHSERQEGV
jgi:hypothetical protein